MSGFLNDVVLIFLLFQPKLWEIYHLLKRGLIKKWVNLVIKK